MPLRPSRKNRPTPGAEAPEPDLIGQLTRLPGPLLALLDADLDQLRARLPGDAVVVPLADPVVPAGRFPTIAVLAPDRDVLTRAVSTLPPMKAPRTVAVYLEYAGSARPPTVRPEWRPLRSLVTVRDGDAMLVVAAFAEPVRSRRVLAEFARQLTRPALTPHQGLRAAVLAPGQGLAGDPVALRLATPAEASAEDLPVPPDVVIGADPAAELPPHHVTGRSPYLLREEDGPLAIGPLDGRLLRPTGFDRSPLLPVGTLAAVDDAAVVELGAERHRISARRGATEELVAASRPHRGLAVTWPEVQNLALARAVAGLAMAGVPVTGTAPPPWAAGLLGAATTAALTAPVDLADDLAREEHSIRLRRAAHREFGLTAWRARVAAAAGLPAPVVPSLSVLIATKRPEMLEHTLEQVRRQRGLDLELVLAPHGFEPDPALVAELAGPRVRTVVRAQPADAVFGEVLAGAADAASGDVVVKMDDDDWYGLDFLTDLLLARDYSGADIVGTPAEYLYLEPLDRTIRRKDSTEEFGRFAAGGTLLLERALLRSVGGFRSVRRFVDASLLSDVLGAGGTLYRMQGLGYVFRRGETGHTWEQDLEFFLNPDRIRASWGGFVPSRLMEA